VREKGRLGETVNERERQRVELGSMSKMVYRGTSRACEGNTRCKATDWVSDRDTLGKSQVGQGVQGSRRAVVTAWERSGCVMQAWSTDVPGLSVMQVVNLQAI